MEKLFQFYQVFFLKYSLIPAHLPSEKSVRQWPGRPAFNPRSSHTKDSKMLLDTSLLIGYVSRVKWSNEIRIKGKLDKILGKEWCLSLYFGVVAIEKGAFVSPSITVANFTMLTKYVMFAIA